MVFALPPEGDGQRRMQCFRCDRPDPMETKRGKGWLQGESAWGRPADVQVAPDGSLLVSDDTAGAIYRIRYRG